MCVTSCDIASRRKQDSYVVFWMWCSCKYEESVGQRSGDMNARLFAFLHNLFEHSFASSQRNVCPSSCIFDSTVSSHNDRPTLHGSVRKSSRPRCGNIDSRCPQRLKGIYIFTLLACVLGLQGQLFCLLVGTFVHVLPLLQSGFTLMLTNTTSIGGSYTAL